MACKVRMVADGSDGMIDDSMCIPRSPCFAALVVQASILNPRTSRAPPQSQLESAVVHLSRFTVVKRVPAWVRTTQVKAI